MNIAFEHSLVWLWLILPAVTLVVFWLYFFRNSEWEWTKGLRYLLAGLRWIVFFVLAALLLTPSIIQLLEETERPRLLIYTDQSASVNPDEKAAVDAFASEAASNLSDKYDVRLIPFGGNAITQEGARLDSLNTDLGEVARSVTEDFYGENIGAVVVASDGIQNKGSDPRYVSIGNTAKLFAIQLGDTSVFADLEVAEVLSNRLAFLNNQFEVKARIIASKLQGKKAIVRLQQDRKTIAQQEVAINTRDFSAELRFLTIASQLGLNKYTVSVDVIEGERNRLNNTAETYVEVLDNRTKVIILGAAPHPDLAFIKRSIEESDQYEVEVLLLQDWDGNTDGADLFVWHGLPRDANDLNQIKPILTDGKPTYSIVTPRVSYRHFNALELGLTIEAGRNQSDEVGAAIQSDFNLFNVEENEIIKRYPPLLAPFGNFILNTDHQVMLYQSVGSIVTDKPLAVYLNRDGKKDGVFLGEGLWKWNLFEANVGTQGWTKTLIQKSVQYLAIKQKRTRLDVDAPRRLEERQEVVFNAAYYNQSYELNNDPEVALTLTDSAGNATDFRFRPTSNAYRVTLGALPPGEYRWDASVAVAGERFTQTGVFTVMRNRAEYMNAVANHRLLSDWADRRGGKSYDIQASQTLIDDLASLESAKPVIHTSKEWSELVEWKWLLFTLVLLLSAEWFIRKYTGYV